MKKEAISSKNGFRRQVMLTLLYSLVLGLLVCASSWGSPFPRKYDHFFKKSVIFLPVGMSWKILKAQCWQESRLRPTVIAKDGGMGLCQFMPKTWNNIKKKYKNIGSPLDPESSIRACALYMAYLYKEWGNPRSREDRYKLALSSYNAGLGNILASQKLSGNKNDYKSIIRKLELVTGFKNSKITKEYVDNIYHKWLPMMK